MIHYDSYRYALVNLTIAAGRGLRSTLDAPRLDLFVASIGSLLKKGTSPFKLPNFHPVAEAVAGGKSKSKIARNGYPQNPVLRVPKFVIRSYQKTA